MHGLRLNILIRGFRIGNLKFVFPTDKSGVVSVRFALIFTAALVLSCENSGADKIRGGALETLLLSGQQISYQCSVAKPTFASLDQGQGITAHCGQCHSGGNIRAGVDVTSYASLSSIVVPNNPNGSILFRVVIPGGLMSQFTSDLLNQAIYCWIKGGAGP
ncbi:hypothetical protein LEP1GSC047_0625 [Leptospira inadai serovar Lyme str. 10]|uniref:Cytochrome c domain-containing protein n=2 Tax=Leptospira inadai serovar Lyme TaxID=293084 RepID=V6HF58_9LEPT|nr:hypothetical protein [Leptospira inadai]EQA38872.1 hypothetical protein LEP1GSC047_0625 [Leptospira inadai serovar Lyme str. 10]PNV72282.1 hypothetical protein BES34_019710 [Leptospira inadai serovar Lyme]